MIVCTFDEMAEYIREIELRIRDAFTNNKVDIFEGTTEERVSEKLISLIKGEMERSK